MCVCAPDEVAFCETSWLFFVCGKDITQAASACGSIASMRATLRMLVA